jgi:hypothetical protein
MNFGVFYQSGHKLVACYKAIEQFRKFYPEVTIDLYEDGSRILEPVTKKFTCIYTPIEQSGENAAHHPRPVVDLESNLNFLKRIYKSCLTNLKDVEWVLYYEDDVWCKREILRKPIYDLNGAMGPVYTPELIEYLKNRFNVADTSRGVWCKSGSLENYQACGGTIFKREKFIQAYEKISEIDWNIIRKLDSRPCEWCDASVSFIFQHAGFTVGKWADWGQYDTKGLGNWFDKTGWSVPMEEQENVAFIHFYKHFYNYKNDELVLV